jgi:ribonuclease Z
VSILHSEKPWITDLRHLLVALLFLPLFACAQATPEHCVEVILTGTQGGPPAVNGLAGAGTLIRYGTLENQCNDIQLQFDVGRGTTMRLSQLGLTPNDIDAVFLTHMHSDHTEGLVGLMQLRWHYMGGPIDLICAADAVNGGHTLSCRAYSEHLGDAFIHGGEIEQRVAENNHRHADGPSGLMEIREVAETAAPVIVWQSGDVTVSAITTTHIPGSLAYRVDTPAGSVVIGGDAGNEKTAPPRATSTSAAVETLAMGADVLVHSAIHPVFAPKAGSAFPVPVYLRQSNAEDLGALARRAGIGQLMLTHLIPSLNTRSHGPFEIPGGELHTSDFESAARKSGFKGEIYVGEDLLSVRLPRNMYDNGKSAK